MKRYDPDQYGGGEGPAMIEDSQGQYVYHDDHLAALAARDAQWERAIRETFRSTPYMQDEVTCVAACRERVQREEQS